MYPVTVMAGIGISGKLAVIAVVCILAGTGIGYFVTLKTVPPKVTQTTSNTANPAGKTATKAWFPTTLTSMAVPHA